MPGVVSYRRFSGLRLVAYVAGTAALAAFSIWLFRRNWSVYLITGAIVLWGTISVLALVRSRAAVGEGWISERFGALRGGRTVRVGEIARVVVTSFEGEYNVVYTLEIIDTGGTTIRLPAREDSAGLEFRAALAAQILDSPAEISDDARWYLVKWQADGATLAT